MKKHLVCLAFCLVLSSALMAQAAWTAPLGYDTVEGNYYGHSLGSYATGRYQAVESSTKGTARVIKRVEYRLDRGTNYTTSNGMGRSWTSVMLYINDAKPFTGLTSTFSTNIVGTPTLVFSSKVAWPTVTGIPKTNPWGGNGMSFPFRSVWTYTGKNNLMLDYHFRGGKLSDNSPWTYVTGGVTKSSSKLFPTDGIFMGDNVSAFNVEVPRGWRTAPICTDSSQAGTFSSRAHHFYLGTKTTVRLRVQTYFTAKTAPVIGAISIRGNLAGTAVPGFGCNKLHIDLSPTAVPLWIFATTNATGHSGWVVDITQTPPASIRGVTTWFQAAWTDSVTGQPKLTIATACTVPPVPIPSTKRSIYYNLVSNPTGFGVFDTHYVHSLPRFYIN
ncbi:MAG: hypothetical protein ACYTKC_04570 [Planctomycetota bacterium]|jgi:hypothetical protein